MSAKHIALYRLPVASATQTGSARVVVDRNKQVYINKQKVVSAQPSGDFLVLTLANDLTMYVKATDYAALRA